MSKFILMIPVFLILIAALVIMAVNPGLLFSADHDGLFLGTMCLFLLICAIIGRYYSD